MKIFLENNSFYYEIEKLTKMFFPNEKLAGEEGTPSDGEPFVHIKTENDGRMTRVFAAVKTEGFDESAEKTVESDGDIELEAALLLYGLLVKLTGVEPPWGVLTGVRPIKLFRKLREELGTAEAAADRFENVFHVSPKKTALTVETEKRESEVLKLTTPKSFSLYIAVPFCPSRCSYCSFVSASTERTKKLIEPYTELLCTELEKTAEIVSKLGLHLESVYMGGGTPTTLNAEQLSRVLGTVRERFDMSGCREFTVEAGRPDTIDEDKLKALKSVGVDRISINPQTLSDEVLERIGRRHTAADVYASFDLARKLSFDHINTDLIAGLPGDTVESFKNTLDKLTQLSPESITIHALAMKRASNLTQNGKMLDRDEAITAAKMLDYADERLHAFGYRPYYLYRQSRMVGNLENTGWAKQGKEGYYNVFIMAETQTIIACGAGAVTKIVGSDGRLERIFNYKYPYEYISSFEQVLERKEGIEALYDKLG